MRNRSKEHTYIGAVCLGGMLLCVLLAALGVK